VFKRVVWTGVGYSLGMASSVYVQRRVRRSVERYAPEHVRRDVADRGRAATERGRAAADRARRGVVDLREAAREGVTAMRAEEQALRQEFGGLEPIEPAGGLHPQR